MHVATMSRDEKDLTARVLRQLAVQYERSKTEQIHRFLKDQVELNRRFREYALHSDDDEANGASDSSSDSETGVQFNDRMSLYKVRPRSAMEACSGELQDIEDDEFDRGSVDGAGCKLSDSDSDQDTKPPLRTTTKASTSSRFARKYGPVPADLRKTGEHQDCSASPGGPLLSRRRLMRNSDTRVSSNADGGPSYVSSTAEIRNPLITPDRKALTKHNVRPKTATGIRSAHVSDNFRVVLNGLPADQLKEEQGHVVCASRMRASAPADTTRARRISWEAERQSDERSLAELKRQCLLQQLPLKVPPKAGRLSDAGLPQVQPSHNMPNVIRQTPEQSNKRSSKDLGVIKSTSESLSVAHRPDMALAKDILKKQGNNEIRSASCNPLEPSFSKADGKDTRAMSRRIGEASADAGVGLYPESTLRADPKGSATAKARTTDPYNRYERNPSSEVAQMPPEVAQMPHRRTRGAAPERTKRRDASMESRPIPDAPVEVEGRWQPPETSRATALKQDAASTPGSGRMRSRDAPLGYSHRALQTRDSSKSGRAAMALKLPPLEASLQTGIGPGTGQLKSNNVQPSKDFQFVTS